MSTDDVTSRHRGLLDEIAKKEGLGECDVTVTGGSLKGDNYLGIISLVTLTSKSTGEELQLVLKSAQTHEKFRELAPVSTAYHRESYMYDTFLPGLKRLQNEHRLSKPFDNFAKLYATTLEDHNECIALENLRAKGYALWNRKLPMNAEHVTMVMETYARLHAASLAWAKLRKDEFVELTQPIFETVFEEKIEAMDGFFDSMKLQIETAINVVGDNELAKTALQKFAIGLDKFFMEEMKDKKYKIVATHGDCWCNNMMFKYGDAENPAKPTQVCLLDWQISILGSPVWDLAYFLCAGTSKEELDKIDHYLRLYHEACSENLRAFGCDPEEVFPRRLLDDHWKKYAKLGLYFGMALLKVVVGNSDEVPDLQKAAENGEDFMLALNFESKNDHLYKQRLTDVCVFMVEHDLI